MHGPFFQKDTGFSPKRPGVVKRPVILRDFYCDVHLCHCDAN